MNPIVRSNDILADNVSSTSMNQEMTMAAKRPRNFMSTLHQSNNLSMHRPTQPNQYILDPLELSPIGNVQRSLLTNITVNQASSVASNFMTLSNIQPTQSNNVTANTNHSSDNGINNNYISNTNSMNYKNNIGMFNSMTHRPIIPQPPPPPQNQVSIITCPICLETLDDVIQLFSVLLMLRIFCFFIETSRKNVFYRYYEPVRSKN